MHGLKSNLLARASLGALAVAAAVTAAPTGAQAQTQLYGGGATLASLLIRDLFDCYAIPPGTTTASPGPRPAGCPASARVNVDATFNYRSVGSGSGQRGWISKSRSRFETPTNPGSTVDTGQATFGLSEAALVQSQLDVYNNGGRFTSTGPLDIANQADNCVPQSSVSPTGTGQNFIAFTLPTPTAGCFDNPRVEAGPAIQIPVAGAGVTVAFDPIYKRVRNADNTVSEYRYQFTDRADGSGGLDLTRAAFCGVFSGAITRWNDPALNQGATPLWPDPTDTAAVSGGDTRGRRVEVTVRDDDSGTTSLFTRALRAQCPSQFTTALPAGFAQAYPGNPTPNSISSTASPGLTFNSTCDLNQGNSLFGGTWVYGRGNEGVAFCLNTASPKKKAGATTFGGRIGYLSPSFVLPAVSVSPFTTYALQTADVANSSGNFINPTPAAIALGLGAQSIPSGAGRADPLQWVANPSGAVAGVSDPSDPAAFPVVGTANLLLYTCYANSTLTADFAQPATAGVPGFLNWVLTPNSSGITNALNNIFFNQGFVRLPTALSDAIVETFANPADPGSYNLFIRPVGSTATASPNCTVGAG